MAYRMACDVGHKLVVPYEGRPGEEGYPPAETVRLGWSECADGPAE